MRLVAGFRAIGGLLGPSPATIPYNGAIAVQMRFLLNKIRQRE